MLAHCDVGQDGLLFGGAAALDVFEWGFHAHEAFQTLSVPESSLNKRDATQI